MKRLACVTILLAACTGGERANTGKCPAGETCSDKTPYGLYFIGEDLGDIPAFGAPYATAVGGTQDIALEYEPHSTDPVVPLDLPFTTDDDGGAGITVDHHTGSTVTIRGAGNASNYLRILDASDGTLFDRKQLTGAAIESIGLVSTDPAANALVPAGMPVAWTGGDRTFVVALWGEVQGSSGPQPARLVDQRMQLAMTGADRPSWDELHLQNVPPGTYQVSVQAGDRPAQLLSLLISDQADSVAAVDPPASIAPAGSVHVCFAGTVQGHFLFGLHWTYVVDGATTTDTDSCLYVSTTRTSGTVAVQASAGGQTTTLMLPIAAARTTPAAPARLPWSGTPAGERAAM